ncbi:MAG: glycerol-3-phosphate 1-O-acyltransferase PlsY [Syntrophomonadaceae bacterium]|nr:glycerol-3-phosphate 1-O-acyltransferase PlsY [Syntrophomonadaceae bacterium]
MTEALLIIACYIIGSIPFSYLLGRFLGGVDIRTKGSGNVGATNVYRTLGPVIGITALIADLLKGVAAVWIGNQSSLSLVLVACCLAVGVGHCYPIFLRFKGGKAVATAAGVVLALSPILFLILVLTFISVVVLSGYVSLGSVLVAILFPILTILMVKPWTYTFIALILAMLVVYRHRENLRRLKAGTEPKFRDRVR